jgi:hypothetical protein
MQELHAIWTHCLVQLIHFSKPYYHPAYLKPLRYLFILSGIFSATPCIARDESSNSRSKRTVPCGFGTCVRRGSIRDNILLYSHSTKDLACSLTDAACFWTNRSAMVALKKDVENVSER